MFVIFDQQIINYSALVKWSITWRTYLEIGGEGSENAKNTLKKKGI